MKISYPIRDKKGKEFSSLDEIMRLIDAEAHGTWLLGGNGLWHGGIHISDVSNPFSSQKFEYADVLMACMAVETSRKFMSTVTELRDVRDSNGNIVYITGRTGRRPRREDHVYTADEIRADPSIA
ncbi:hypothetical protein AIT98_000577 [Salmonella enterica subsp. indica]|uniref:Uncharacterized protein n=1 Tax=Salmonella enterica TaxID=28901 RepID=A0A701ZH76_SALER|nr:hypothetical protein [Salmonella enterica]HAC6576950.1 hypothetical protein [Salmonella enterica subsp. indica]HBC0059333.1 hypothetical protein [Salmonella enterica]HCL5303488.1 hypothetical protein [Salmonella enterica]